MATTPYFMYQMAAHQQQQFGAIRPMTTKYPPIMSDPTNWSCEQLAEWIGQCGQMEMANRLRNEVTLFEIFWLNNLNMEGSGRGQLSSLRCGHISTTDENEFGTGSQNEQFGWGKINTMGRGGKNIWIFRHWNPLFPIFRHNNRDREHRALEGNWIKIDFSGRMKTRKLQD